MWRSHDIFATSVHNPQRCHHHIGLQSMLWQTAGCRRHAFSPTAGMAWGLSGPTTASLVNYKVFRIWTPRASGNFARSRHTPRLSDCADLPFFGDDMWVSSCWSFNDQQFRIHHPWKQGCWHSYLHGWSHIRRFRPSPSLGPCHGMDNLELVSRAAWKWEQNSGACKNQSSSKPITSPSTSLDAGQNFVSSWCQHSCRPRCQYSLGRNKGTGRHAACQAVGLPAAVL